MKTVCVIPARYGSERLPGKPLRMIGDKSLIQWTILAARKFQVTDDVIVATDHKEILRAAESVGCKAVMTDPECPSGTDRIQQALRGIEADIVINLQGDEPLMSAETVEKAHAALLSREADAATACVPVYNEEQFSNPNIVKVVCDYHDMALYFSRSPIPSLARRSAVNSEKDYLWGYKHLGLYIYKREALERFVTLPMSNLESLEKLEQLRMLENGMKLVCVKTPHDSIGVDVEADIGHVQPLLEERIGD